MLCLATVSFGGATAVVAQNDDPEGCAGLTEYLADLHELTDELFAAYGGKDGQWTPEPIDAPVEDDSEDEDVLSMSPDELQTIVDLYQSYADGLSEITPPDWLRDWHELRVTNAQTLANMFKEAKSAGLFVAAMGSMERVDEINVGMAAAQALVLGSCPQFLELLHQHDTFSDQVDYDRLPQTDDDSSQGASPTSVETAGTPEPVRLRRTGKINEWWKVRVVKTIDDPYQIDSTASWFTDWLDDNPPSPGEQLFTVRVEITNTSDKAASPREDLSFGLVTADGFTYTETQSCGSVPGQLSYSDQIRAGETFETNLCWYVETRDVESLGFFVEPSFSFEESERVVFSLD
jgi:hypothetical protein